MLEPLSDETEDEMMLRDAMEEEAAKVSNRMANADKPLPFDYCRLGSIHRKVGEQFILLVKVRHCDVL